MKNKIEVIVPDGLAEIIALHAELFGDTRMEAGTEGTDGADDEGTDGDEGGKPADPPEEPEAPKPKPKPKGESKDESDDGGFTPITSQEQLDRIVQDRLTRERKKFADYDTVKSENGTLKATIQSIELRYQIASEKEVPAKFLVGTTKEELEASADELLGFAGRKTDKRVGYDPNQGTGGSKPGAAGQSGIAEADKRFGKKTDK